MQENPLGTIGKLDPELGKCVLDSRQFALADGALSGKFKALIAMSLDASLGAVDGVRSLAQAALQAGATKEEIMEALRVVYYISGGHSMYVASRALKDIL